MCSSSTSSQPRVRSLRGPAHGSSTAPRPTPEAPHACLRARLLISRGAASLLCGAAACRRSAEYDVLLALLGEAARAPGGAPPPFRQLLVEFHPQLLAAADADADAAEAAAAKHGRVVEALRRAGFEPVAVVGGMKDGPSRLRAALWGCQDTSGRTASEWTFVRVQGRSAQVSLGTAS